MTDINKQIEEEAWEYSTYELARCGYIRGYNSCLHSARWRKVSEDLPPLDTQVLVKTSNGKFSISEMYIPKDCNGGILGYKEWKGSFSFKCSIVEWKPID